jgi:hypothetical protein
VDRRRGWASRTPSHTSLTVVPPVLTWVSIYWHSAAGPAASLRIYYEATLAGDVVAAELPAARKVPAGISLFPRELSPNPVSCVSASDRCV